MSPLSTVALSKNVLNVVINTLVLLADIIVGARLYNHRRPPLCNESTSLEQRKTESIEIERSSKRKNKRKLPEDNSELSPPAAKKQKAGKGKVMNKKIQDTLLTLLDSIDSSIFKRAICDKVKEQIIPEKLKQLACCHLLENEQLRWHQHCSVGVHVTLFSSHPA